MLASWLKGRWGHGVGGNSPLGSLQGKEVSRSYATLMQT